MDMTNTELLQLFRQVFPEDATSVRGCSRYCDSRRSMLILLATYTRLFNKAADGYLYAFIGFANDFVEDHFTRYSPVASMWWELSLFFNEGARPDNAKKIIAIIQRHFPSGDLDIDWESLLIMLHVAIAILYRKQSWWHKHLVKRHIRRIKEYPYWCPANTVGVFLHHFYEMFSAVFNDNPLSNRETHYILAKAVVGIHHFTERYLGQIVISHSTSTSAQIGRVAFSNAAVLQLIKVISSNSQNEL